ncbi:KIR-like protein [Plasmodium coatneyi]|uniref:KIR-like protein n=1 Tax=Plasmodium coatneyi TaxID=208452 RepID=A0A1B1DT49_9APIC|nr:KIR-like protein [Plasmodium coatneyi]ANQ05765.1 KIR-like protein [Plasmodium coatneyi]
MAGVDPSKPQSFPSWTDYYGKFENGGGIQEPDCTDEKDCGKEVTNYSLRNRDLQMYEGKIRAALHYLLETYRKKGPKNSLESTARHFFYYWLGEKRSNSRKGSTEFRGDIILLCNAINQPSEKGPFGIPCDNPEKVIFDQRKRIFDYYYDYSTVQKKILEDGDASREKWSSYLEGITKACDAIKDYCKPEVENTRGDDQYCKQFEAQYGAYCSAAKLPELEYKLKSAQQEKQSTQLKLNSALHQANKASSLSSTFGTVAAIELPAVIFFLYKVKLQFKVAKYK